MKLYQILLIIFIFHFYNSTAQTATAEDFKNHVSYLASEQLEGRGLGTIGKDLAKEYIKEQFISAGLKPFDDDYFQEFSLKFYLARVNATNIVGIVEGADSSLKNEYIVIGAHYDHLGYDLSKEKEKNIYPGADDNASGVAALIELARYFAKPENNPKRSLIFIAFDAEEGGLHGSYHFVNNLEKNTLKNIKAMFNFDMVGMLEANKKLEIKGIKTIVNGEEIAKKHSGDIPLFNVNSKIEERTDTHYFGEKGIPSVHVFTGLKSPYHQYGDKADLLDYEGMVKINNFITNVITELANQPNDIEAISDLKKVQENNKVLTNRFRVGAILNLGTGKHLYKDEFFDSKSSFAYSTGLHFNYKLTRKIHLSFETLYDYNTGKSANGIFKRHSFTFPLNIEFGTSTTSGKDLQRLFIFGGTYYRSNLSVKDGDISLSDNLKQNNEWGYNLGFGLEAFNTTISLTNRGSFNSVFTNKKVYQSGAYLTIIYKFW
ncbi:hypothetical protein CAPN001_17810 [Capnocytophaga stomatis]|uniref:M20/M25/M40 family metallo-hydrolase n=1 Tax=Capnocytophaga stomatis TaxID=1848904 RepID=UPI0019521AB6|nr:M20/M25/M40 family metallo-hydrolase [Capnocytophaga stomatis]GIJ97212.1 hypothetical protein CAPN001_17810 [Capnocytophaga stomatis]